MIETKHRKISVRRQCQLLALPRSSLYYLVPPVLGMVFTGARDSLINPANMASLIGRKPPPDIRYRDPLAPP